ADRRERQGWQPRARADRAPRRSSEPIPRRWRPGCRCRDPPHNARCAIAIEAALTAIMRGTARTAGLMTILLLGVQGGASAQDVEHQGKPVEAEDHALVLEIGA